MSPNDRTVSLIREGGLMNKESMVEKAKVSIQKYIQLCFRPSDKFKCIGSIAFHIKAWTSKIKFLYLLSQPTGF